MGQAEAGRPAWTELIDLASERLGGAALATNDDFFAPMSNLIKPEKPVFIPGKYTEFGKWMDGWESRRRREPGHDWCILALGRAGSIRGVVVDTAHFKGNQPEACTIEAAELPGTPDARAVQSPDVRWTEVIPRTTLAPDSEHFIEAPESLRSRRFTHVRLNIFPDGGVARLRVHGAVLPDWSALASRSEAVDLAAAENAGLVVACNDMHFGSRHNLVMPGRAANMGDGWETRRRRGPGYDWCIVRLGHRGTIEKIEVDTNHFKGNFPESCMIEACDATTPSGASEHVPNDRAEWRTLLARTKLKADTRHFFEKEIELGKSPCTHLRLNIYPDGGVSRMRVWGRPIMGRA